MFSELRSSPLTATNLAERGVGVREPMALAGYSNMATTQYYIDLRFGMPKATGELVLSNN